MGKLKKLLLMIIFILGMVLCFTACGNGATILTDVTLEDDFSGSRVMEVAIAKATFDEYFGGSIDDLSNLLKEQCPEQLTWKVDETDLNYVCVFTLAFDSMDTYKVKVVELLGEDREISVVRADTILAQGISYNENFNSTELLSWFCTELVDKGFVSSGNKSEIFKSDTTTFMFDSKEYASTNYINVSDLNYLPFGYIDILTTPHYDKTYDRIVVFHIPQSSMDQKNEEITAYLEEGVPSTASKAWGTDSVSGDNLFTVTLQRVTIEDLDAAMKRIFHSEAASAVDIAYSDDLTMLECGQGLMETLDVSAFISNSSATASLRYFISSEVTSEVEERYEDGSTNLLGGYELEDHAGYLCVYESEVSEVTLKVHSKISYIPDMINVTTQVKGKDELKRNIEFVYFTTFDEAEAAQLQDNVSKTMEGYAEATYTTEEGNYIVAMDQKGTEEEVNIGFQTIFNSPDSVAHYARESKKIAFRCASVFEESLSFKGLFGEKANNMQVNYTAQLTAGEKISEKTIASYAEDSTVKIDGNRIRMPSSVGTVHCEVIATKFNVIALFWWLLILFFVAALILIGYMGFLQLKAANVNIDGKEIAAGLQTKANQILRKKQCSVCKATIDTHVKYCTKCGSKSEKIETNN